MKKALLFCLVLVMIGAGAFAQQISIGSSGSATWDVVDSDTPLTSLTQGYDTHDHLGSGIHQSNGGDGTGLTLSASGVADNVTFAIDMDIDGDGLSVGDNAYIEIRPFEATGIPFAATILVGKSDKNETRDDAKFGIYNWDRFGPANNTTYEDQNGMIFGDLLDVDSGVAITLYPIQGLTIGAAAELAIDGLYYSTVDNAWASANFYAAYEIANVGKIRLGWDGRVQTDATYTQHDFWGIVGAAFDFDMVDNLHIGIGAKIPVLNEADYDYDDAYEAYYRFALYANYNFAGLGLPLTIHALFNGWYNNIDNTVDNFGFQAGLAADYEVVDNVPIFLDVRYANDAYMGNTDGSLTFGVGISKVWTNAELGVAFIGDVFGAASKNHSAVADGMAWSIPVKFAYSF